MLLSHEKVDVTIKQKDMLDKTKDIAILPYTILHLDGSTHGKVEALLLEDTAHDIPFIYGTRFYWSIDMWTYSRYQETDELRPFFKKLEPNSNKVESDKHNLLDLLKLFYKQKNFQEITSQWLKQIKVHDTDNNMILGILDFVYGGASFLKEQTQRKLVARKVNTSSSSTIKMDTTNDDEKLFIKLKIYVTYVLPYLLNLSIQNRLMK